MHNFLARANAVFAFAITAMAAVTFFCFLTTVYNDTAPEVRLAVNDHRV